MNFYEKYLVMCKKKGVSPSAAATAAGINKASVYRWKNGMMPRDANILALADYLGCKPVDLFPDDRATFGKEEISPEKVSQKSDNLSATISLEGLKDDERMLLDGYRTMTGEQKLAMQILIRGMKNAD